MPRTSIAIIGGGPAGLFAAQTCAKAGCDVHVYDAMPSIGRKFLMAGRGGLNLTHSDDMARFMTQYRETAPHLAQSITDFSPQHLQDWCADLGQETFIGSSGRVFPRAMKASPLLRAWLARLTQLGVQFHTRHDWQGWNEAGALVFKTRDGEKTITPSATILATGGASWPRLGADGRALDILTQTGIETRAFMPSNCGFLVKWSPIFQEKYAGEPLKRIMLRFAGESVPGEAIITREGIEGGAIYALSAPIRDAVMRDGAADLLIDFKPDMDKKALVERLKTPRGKQTIANFLRKAAGVSPVVVGLMHEYNLAKSWQLARMKPERLADLIKDYPVKIHGIAGMDRAISAAGGVPFAALDAALMLRSKNGVFVAGEMLDWEAPTGGYLLQACFATGHSAAKGALNWLKQG